MTSYPALGEESRITVFYIYQIAELLKYEHDGLQAVWLEEERCFKLSLNK